MSTATAIAIIQAAMLWAGQNPIESLAEDSDAADTVRRLYPDQKRALLACHPWKFADKRAQLSRKAEVPDSEWAWQFQQPPDRVLPPRALFTSADQGVPALQDFEFGDGVVFADAEELWAAYTYEAPESRWPPYFIEFAQHALAAAFGVAFQVTDSIIEREDRKAWGMPSEGRRGGLFATARSADGRFAPTRTLITHGGPLLQARQTRA